MELYADGYPVVEKINSSSLSFCRNKVRWGAKVVGKKNLFDFQMITHLVSPKSTLAHAHSTPIGLFRSLSSSLHYHNVIWVREYLLREHRFLKDRIYVTLLGILLNKLIQRRLIAVSQALFTGSIIALFVRCVPLLVSFVWMLEMRRFLNGYLSSCIRKSYWRKAFEHQLCFVFSSCLLMSILESRNSRKLWLFPFRDTRNNVILVTQLCWFWNCYLGDLLL